MRSSPRPMPALVATVALTLAATSAAQSTPPRLLHPLDHPTARLASLHMPMNLAFVAQASSGPVWTAQGLWQAKPAGLHGLQAVQDASPANDPVWDPSSRAWYAYVYGALVRVEPEGSLPVVLESLPGHDFDVRAARGLVVYRDPNRDQLVLQRLGPRGGRRVLLEGEFYNPRFSPDGTRIAVSQLCDGGGHLWLIESETGVTRDLGRGYDPAWKPDGTTLLFLRLDDNGHELTASHLYTYMPGSGVTRHLATTRSHLVTRPTFSPDGRWIAFVDDVSGQVMASPLPESGGAR
ncbi:MAG: hypothetical protein ABIJ09_15095 [Pseudomonadota bacterium]